MLLEDDDPVAHEGEKIGCVCRRVCALLPAGQGLRLRRGRDAKRRWKARKSGFCFS
jgi:hypothetical protein